MTVQVLRKFRDIEKNVIRYAGETFECTRERYEAIIAKNPRLVKCTDEETEESQNTPDTSENEADNQGVCDIAQMTENQLREFAKKRKIKGYTKMSADKLKEALEQ